MSEKQKDSPNINKNVHPPVVAMIFIIVGLFLGRLVPALAGMNAILKNIGLGLTFIGFLFGVMTMSRLVIEQEEAYLEKKFKDQYTDYRSRVRRWI